MREWQIKNTYRGLVTMKYLIFTCELIAIGAWLFFGADFSIVLKVVGVLVIIGLSQLIHSWLGAR